MVELLYGTRAASTVGINAPAFTPSKQADVILPDVEIHYCLFEIPMAVAQARLPTGLHPSVPAMLGITVWRCRAGPLGPFALAYLGIACRTGIKPRHLIHGAFCDKAEVSEWLRMQYGLNCRAAKVHNLEGYDRIHSRVEVAGCPVLDLVTDQAQPLAGRGAMVKYSPILNAVRIGEDTALVQMETSFDFKRVLRGRPHTAIFDAAALGDDSITPNTPVSGTFSIADINLHAPRFKLDVALPAEQGGAKKL